MMRLSIKLIFVLLVTLHGNFVFAQPVYQEASGLNGNPFLSEGQSDASVSEQSSVTWPVLPGESVEDIAALFYPKSKIMQQRFIAKTLQLSREINPELDPKTTFNQAGLIVIPNIKFLGKHSGSIKSASLKNKNNDSQSKPKLLQSYGIKDHARFEFSPKIQAIYDDLIRRNIQFKLDLEKLNNKLANLQQSLATLKNDLIRIIDLALSIVDNKNKVIKQLKGMSASNNALIAEPTKNQHSKSTHETTSISKPVNVAASRAMSAESISRDLLLSIVGLFLVIGLALYIRRQLKDFHPFRAANLNSIEKKAIVNGDELASPPITVIQAVDNPAKDVEFSGSIPGMDSEFCHTLEQQKEADMVLEQAKIYTNMNRFKEAVMLLKTQIQETPKAALHHWFYLLDIYRNSNQKEAFLSNAKQLHEKFNIMMPQWENSTLPLLVATSLEELPHIVGRLTKLWATEGKVTENMVETKSYLDELLMDNRNTERMGFGVEVFQEIMLLRDMLDMRCKLAIGN